MQQGVGALAYATAQAISACHSRIRSSLPFLMATLIFCGPSTMLVVAFNTVMLLSPHT